jgi:hypothetical protein
MIDRDASLKRFAIALAFGMSLIVGSAASAQTWYYVNNQPVSVEIAQAMAAQALPFGRYYWVYDGWVYDGGGSSGETAQTQSAQAQAAAPAYNPAISSMLQRHNNIMTDLTIGQMRAMSGR